MRFAREQPYLRSIFRLAGIVALLLTPALHADGAADDGAEATGPMTNQDVVMMVASGQPEQAILDAIRAAPEVDFDLSSEVLDELKLAGVPQRVLDTMRRRQGRVPAPAPVQEQTQPAEELEYGTVRIVLNKMKSDGKPLNVVSFDEVHPDTRHHYGLGAGHADLRITDLALVVLAYNTRLVPDGWRTETILAPHPNLGPHWVVASRTGAERRQASWYHSIRSDRPGSLVDKELGILSLDVDPVLSFRIPADVPIELHVGFAMRLGEGDIYYIWHLSEPRVITVTPDEVAVLNAKFSGAGAKSLEKKRIEFGQ